MSSDSVTTRSQLQTVRSTGSSGPERRHSLLIVDDEIDVLESLRHLFHRAYRVVTASSGIEAVDILEREDIHMILSDQRMPGMSGDVFLSHARRIKPDAIRMLFTGYADIQAVINAVNEGHIYRYILKPWDATELEGILRQAADQYELLAERRRLIADLQRANARLIEANETLAEAGQLKSAFIEVASHEFNTPITLVLGLSELLRLINPDRPESERAIVERISASAKQLARLITNTLTLMKADNFRQTLLPSPVDLAAVLRATLEKLSPFAKSRQLQLIDQVPDDLGRFEIDAEKIDAAVVNLLTNAIKFTPDGRSITLQARLLESDEAEIRVIDQGDGLEARSLKQLFQPFFTQFDSSRHSSGDFGYNKRGLGLGLSIAKQFVELHGGSVSAESELGVGTTVIIRIPRHPQAKSNLLNTAEDQEASSNPPPQTG